MAADEAEVADSPGGEATADGVCAAHPERRTDATCERCGDYACDECLQLAVDEVLRCTACRARLPVAIAMPWEEAERAWPVRLAATWWRTLTSPLASFRHLPYGSLASPWSFAAVTFALVNTGALVGRVLSLRIGADLVTTLAVGVVFGTLLMTLMWPFCVGGGFHLAARLLGGAAPFGFSLRAGSYTGSAFVLMLMQALPISVPALALLAFVLGGLWTCVMLVGAAQGAHGLRGARAVAAGVLPVAMLQLTCCLPAVYNLVAHDS